MQLLSVMAVVMFYTCELKRVLAECIFSKEEQLMKAQDPSTLFHIHELTLVSPFHPDSTHHPAVMDLVSSRFGLPISG